MTWTAVLLIAAVVTALVLALRALGAFVPSELALYDFLVVKRSRPLAEPSPVVLVGCSEEDLKRWGWPLSDEVLDKVLRAILAQDPRAVGIDIYRDGAVPPGSDELARSLADRSEVFGVQKIGQARTAIAPHPVLYRANRAGFSDMVVDAGGVLRRALLYMDESGRVFQSFPLLLALKYLEGPGITPTIGDARTGAMKLGPALIEPLEADSGGYVRIDAAGYQFLLDYLGGPSPFQMLTLSELLETPLASDTFRGKIVIVGGAAESVKDFFYSPFQDQHGKRPILGIAAHAHVVDQLLRTASGATPITRTTSEAVELAAVFVAALVASALTVWLRVPLIMLATAAVGLLILGALSWVAFERFVWFPLLPQSAAWIAALVGAMGYMSWRAYTERNELMSLFARHVAPEIAREVWTRREELLEPSGEPRCQRVTATVLFSDIKGFTTISEALGPREQMSWLNRYMSAMIEIVQKHGGTVNQLIGDCVMAVYGVPIPRSAEVEIRADAVNAVDTALAMRAALDRVNEENRRLRLPPISIRIGIHTGPVVTGALGGKARVQFAIVGDTVNTAARLESLKLEDADGFDDDCCRVLIGQDTLDLLDGRYDVVALGVMALRGKNQPLAVYRVRGVRAG